VLAPPVDRQQDCSSHAVIQNQWNVPTVSIRPFVSSAGGVSIQTGETAQEMQALNQSRKRRE
jgi:hypothetical protein